MNSDTPKKQTLREKLLESRIDCDTNRCVCLTCDISFSSIKTLYFHMSSRHAEKRMYYVCPICDLALVHFWSVSRHIRTVHKKTKEETANLKINIKSTFSPKSTHKNNNGDASIEWQFADYQKLKCLHCERTFSTPANLRRHAARHLGLARFWCVICNYKAFNRSECQDHIKRNHLIKDPQKYISENCGDAKNESF